MADTTWGVKVSEELKDQINMLIEKEGIPAKDFIQQMVNLFSLEKAKQQIPEVAQDFKELQALSQRINNIYLSIAYRTENLSKSAIDEYTKVINKKDNEISKLNESLSTTMAKYESMKQEASKLQQEAIELNNRIIEVNQSSSRDTYLIKELQDKIQTLTNDIAVYEDTKSQNDILKKENTEATEQINKLENQVSTLLQDESTLRNRIDELQIIHEQKLNELEQSNKQTLDQLKKEFQLSKEQEILELKQGFQLEKMALEEKLNETIRSYEAKIQSLNQEHFSALQSANNQMAIIQEEYHQEVNAYQKQLKETIAQISNNGSKQSKNK